jgi:glutamate formiminotransferase/formiminotetrahydrofolate cyclodeaminase
MKLNNFADETASDSPAPGGGSIAAYVGALGASLAIMVANLSVVKRGWHTRWKEFSDFAEEGQKLKEELLKLVDEDTKSFNAIMEAFRLSKKTEEEKSYRSQQIQKATKYAIEVPFKVMQASYNSMRLIKDMAEKGNPNSVSDAGVAALCARTAVIGAHLNVKINSKDLKDQAFLDEILKKAAEIERNTISAEAEILEIVEKVNA